MIHWKYIKGLNQNNGANSLYTFLSFPYYYSSSMNSFNHAPTIYVNSSNTLNTTYSLGRIITEKASGQFIDQVFWFKNDVKISNNKKLQWYKSDGSTLVTILAMNSSNEVSFSGAGKTISVGDSMSITGFMSASTYVTAGSYATVGTYLNVGNSTSYTDTGAISAKKIYSEGICQASYFNATSDSRAKTDLVPLSINALDLIKRVQLYSFKYKDSKLPSIGILAQDVKDVNIEGFKLVDNEEASGIDMDYMSIHESKLIYVLWKAIQEQQKEIDDLKAQLAK